MKSREWDQEMIKEITGFDVDELWDKYQKSITE